MMVQGQVTRGVVPEEAQSMDAVRRLGGRGERVGFGNILKRSDRISDVAERGRGRRLGRGKRTAS
jgi:hypothetical protein